MARKKGKSKYYYVPRCSKTGRFLSRKKAARRSKRTWQNERRLRKRAQRRCHG